jgi:hypothetical protein
VRLRIEVIVRVNIAALLATQGIISLLPKNDCYMSRLHGIPRSNNNNNSVHTGGQVAHPSMRDSSALSPSSTSSPLLPCSNLRPRLTRSSSDNHALTQCKLPAALRFKQSSYDCSSWFTKTETQRVCSSRRDIAFVAKIPSSSTMASIQDLSREQSFLASECDTPPGSRSFE